MSFPTSTPHAHSAKFPASLPAVETGSLCAANRFPDSPGVSVSRELEHSIDAQPSNVAAYSAECLSEGNPMEVRWTGIGDSE